MLRQSRRPRRPREIDLAHASVPSEIEVVDADAPPPEPRRRGDFAALDEVRELDYARDTDDAMGMAGLWRAFESL